MHGVATCWRAHVLLVAMYEYFYFFKINTVLNELDGQKKEIPGSYTNLPEFFARNSSIVPWHAFDISGITTRKSAL